MKPPMVNDACFIVQEIKSNYMQAGNKKDMNFCTNYNCCIEVFFHVAK